VVFVIKFTFKCIVGYRINYPSKYNTISSFKVYWFYFVIRNIGGLHACILCLKCRYCYNIV